MKVLRILLGHCNTNPNFFNARKSIKTCVLFHNNSIASEAFRCKFSEVAVGKPKCVAPAEIGNLVDFALKSLPW